MTSRSRSRRIPFAVGCVLSVAALALAAPSPAATVSFAASIGDETRTANAEIVEAQGTSYVPLSSVIRQFHGECVLFPERAQVDFNGQSALLRVDDTQVNSSLGPFLLRHPVLREDVHLLVALSDIERLFEKAFRVYVRHSIDGRSPAPAAPASPRPDARVVSQELVEPQEPEAFADLFSPEPAPAALAQPGSPAGRLTRLEVVVIDPGHGGTDDGAVGRGGLTEKALSLAIAHKLEQAVQSTLGAQVLLTRQEDADLSLAARTTFANYHKGQLFISLHAGASFSPAAHGFEIFCLAPDGLDMPPAPGEATPLGAPAASPGLDASGGAGRDAGIWAVESGRVAESVSEALLSATSSVNRGVHRVRCRVLENLRMPGFLIEVGCLTNGAEEALLDTDAYQEQLARGIVAGIQAYLASPVAEEPAL
ncbi:MAG: N-acetylmuramoyl-L-alanine amidase [Candidatus Hydrogenedentes bacterium]|nr:N-acetylmuramoyl-L-alanine amidase [Candidatus Hydrogenedentota bacterium]